LGKGARSWSGKIENVSVTQRIRVQGGRKERGKKKVKSYANCEGDYTNRANDSGNNHDPKPGKDVCIGSTVEKGEVSISEGRACFRTGNKANG